MRTEEIMIKMRDGVRLQNFLYLPSGKGPFPALLARCMYGADRVEENARFWMEKGYGVLLQNIRGRHGSEGGPVGRNDFAEDGYDTMEWMVAQPWCNQRIGTFGRSALARVQVATAFLGTPGAYGNVSNGAAIRHDVPFGRGDHVQPDTAVDVLCPKWTPTEAVRNSGVDAASF